MIESNLGFWDVVEDPNPPAQSSATASSSHSNAPGDSSDASSELELAESEYESPQTLLKKQSIKKDVDWSKFEPITHEQFEKMRRKAKSPVWSMVSVLLGGVASIPVATLLIWHLLGKDPFQAGPTVARYLPWVVPAQFHARGGQRFNDPPIPPEQGSGFRKFDSVMTPPEPADVQYESPAEVPLNATQAEAILAPKSRRAGGAPAVPTPYVAVDNSTGSTASASMVAPEAPAPKKNDEHVFKTITKVESDFDAWENRPEDREEQRRIAQETYSDLASLAASIHQLPAGSPLRRLIRTELDSIGSKTTEQKDIQQLIQAGSRHWISTHRDESSFPMAIIVEVDKAEEVESAWQISATEATSLGTNSLKIVAPKESLPAIASGQKLLIFGVMNSVTATASAESAVESKESAAPSESTKSELAFAGDMLILLSK